MDGILNVHKEAGFTSFDVVAKLRGILGQKKIGHTGTLDPAATGVLPVCVGKATKVCGLLTDKDKSYHAVCRLGIETDTLDMTGEITGKSDFSFLTQQQITEAVSGFRGEICQIPPMYSAGKVNGKRLYQLAREGKTVERRERTVFIRDICVTDIRLDDGSVSFDVTCSKGTYIRTLCQDIGRKLGVCAVMDKLVRTRVADFCLEEAMTLQQIETAYRENPEEFPGYMRTVDSLFPEYPKLTVKRDFEARLFNGNLLSPQHFVESGAGRLPEGENVLVYDTEKCFKAVYQKTPGGYKVVKMF